MTVKFLWMWGILVLVVSAFGKPLEADQSDQPEAGDDKHEQADPDRSPSESSEHENIVSQGDDNSVLSRRLSGLSDLLKSEDDFRTAKEEALYRKHLDFLLLDYVKRYAVPWPQEVPDPRDTQDMTPSTTTAVPQQTDDDSPGWREASEEDLWLTKWDTFFRNAPDDVIERVARMVLQTGHIPASMLRPRSPREPANHDLHGSPVVSDVCCIVG